MGIDTLIVDDDEMTVFLHQVFVKENNFNDNSKTFYNGKEALEYLDENHHEKQNEYCVLLDLNMPVFDGWDFLKGIQEKGYKDKVKVVILTSSVNELDRQKANVYPQVVAFLEKPLNDEKINNLKVLEPFKAYFDNKEEV